MRTGTDTGGRARRRGPNGLTAALVLTGLLAVAGCGDEDSSEPSASPETATDERSEPVGLVAAQEAVEEHSSAPTNIGVTAPLTTPVSGKEIYYLEQDVPVMKVIGDNLERAAQELDVTLTRISAGSTPQSWGEAFDRAVQDAPDAVLAGPIPAAVVGNQLQDLAGMQIPVVVWTSADLPEQGNGITLNFDGLAFYQRQGELMADWVTADASGQAEVAFFNIPDFPSLAPLQQAFSDRLEEVCPDCSMSVVDVGATSIGTELPARVVSHLQSNPGTGYVVMGFGDMMIGVPQAVAAAGLDGNVELLTQSGGQVNYEYVKEGLQSVELALPFGLYSWKLMDAVARLLAGESTAPDEEELIPTQFLTTDDITFDPSEPWPGVDGYEEAFRELWGV